MARQIGIITNDQTKVFQRSVIAGIQIIAEQADYELLVDSRDAAQAPHQQTDLPLGRLAGLIVIANATSDAFLHEAYAGGIPISLISHRVSDPPVPTVIPNNAQGIAKMVEHLVVTCGREQLVFINGDLNQNDGIERRDAFLQELTRHNLPIDPQRLLEGRFIPAVAADSLRALLATDTSFDAIIAADYLMALEAIAVLKDHGLRVPQDVAVIGFGDGPEARDHGLTAIAADVAELGKRSARQLLGQINGLNIRGTTLLSVSLEIRESCGCSLQNANS